jgi:tRNA A37 threonylcarbamoyladenosine synthetase subunit TsaC/SUA5/YrdC
LDAGECSEKTPSTVVQCSEDGVKILREGSISGEKIKQVTA